MKPNRKNHLALWLATATLPLMAASAFAQIRVDTSQSPDANNRVGSGGSNNPIMINHQITGNDIANGNVTGGAAFQGNGVPFNNPSDFHGPVAGLGIDTFIRDSTGVPTGAHPMMTPGYAGPQAFYPASITTTPPDGFVSEPGYQGGGGNFTAAAPITAQPQDLRLGVIDYTMNPPLPVPGDLLIPSQVDPNAPSSPTQYFSASPLYGVRPFQSQTDNSSVTSTSTTGIPGAAQPQLTDQDRIMAMRRELVQAAQQGTSGQNNPNQPLTQVSGNGPLQPLMPGGTTTNINAPLTPLQPTGSALMPISVSPLAGDTSRIPDVQLPTPAQQSQQYAQMQQRLAAYNKEHPATPIDSSQEFLTDLQARRLSEPNPNTPSSPTDVNPDNPQAILPNPTPTPDNTGVIPPSPQSPAEPALPPVEVSSLATGIKAPGLAHLMNDAEDQIQHQQYGKAIETYDDAAAVAPNNPLIPIGRANAELGGSYYQQAAADLRAAFKQDSAVMMAQYDLERILGDQRIKFIVTDLKQIASDSPQNPTPVFLLAYIAYNTHHEDRAAGWLDVADKRSGGTDDVIPLLKKYWTFNPSTQPSDK